MPIFIFVYSLYGLSIAYMTENVAIYALSSGKFLNVRKLARVKDLTNIMSV